jgi:hypothetical protein
VFSCLGRGLASIAAQVENSNIRQKHYARDRETCISF